MHNVFDELAYGDEITDRDTERLVLQFQSSYTQQRVFLAVSHLSPGDILPTEQDVIQACGEDMHASRGRRSLMRLCSEHDGSCSLVVQVTS